MWKMKSTEKEREREREREREDLYQLLVRRMMVTYVSRTSWYNTFYVREAAVMWLYIRHIPMSLSLKSSHGLGTLVHFSPGVLVSRRQRNVLLLLTLLLTLLLLLLLFFISSFSHPCPGHFSVKDNEVAKKRRNNLSFQLYTFFLLTCLTAFTVDSQLKQRLNWTKDEFEIKTCV